MHRALASLVLAAFFILAASIGRSTSSGARDTNRYAPADDPKANTNGIDWRDVEFNSGWLGLAGLAGLLGLRTTRRDDL